MEFGLSDGYAMPITSILKPACNFLGRSETTGSAAAEHLRPSPARQSRNTTLGTSLALHQAVLTNLVAWFTIRRLPKDFRIRTVVQPAVLRRSYHQVVSGVQGHTTSKFFIALDLKEILSFLTRKIYDAVIYPFLLACVFLRPGLLLS